MWEIGFELAARFRFFNVTDLLPEILKLMELMELDKNITGRFPHDENWSTKTANQMAPKKE